MGHGSTAREAAKASLRAAVEQVVGTMVDATIFVKNDELIENEILTYAPGMVEKATQIGEPKKSAYRVGSVPNVENVIKKNGGEMYGLSLERVCEQICDKWLASGLSLERGYEETVP